MNHSLEELLKAANKRQENLNSLKGISTFQSLTESIIQREKAYRITGLEGITGLASSVLKTMEPYDKVNNLMKNANVVSLINAVPQNQINTGAFAFSGISSSIAQIFNHNKGLSNQIASVAASQLSLSDGLVKMAKSINNPQLDKFNGLNIAIQGITNSYLKEIARSKSWADLDIVEEVNDTITSISEQLVGESETLTNEKITDFKEEVLAYLTALLGKITAKNSLEFIFRLMAIIGFINVFFPFITNNDDVIKVIQESTKSVLESVEKDNLKNGSKHTINIRFEKRVSTANVNLRSRNHKRSEIIGLVKKGQEVTVLEIRHKWILIAYTDYETGEPKSGFVFKKYFERLH